MNVEADQIEWFLNKDSLSSRPVVVCGASWIFHGSIDTESNRAALEVVCNRESRHARHWTASASFRIEMGKEGGRNYSKNVLCAEFTPAVSWMAVVFRDGLVLDNMDEHMKNLGSYEEAAFDGADPRIKITMTVESVTGFKVCSPPLLDVCDRSNRHDKVLIADGSRFYVRSQVLSMWSGYFDKLFNSDFAESRQNEIEIGNVAADEFRQLLNQMMPRPDDVTYDSVGHLLANADRFDIPLVTQKCVDYIREDYSKQRVLGAMQIMSWADQFMLLDLQDIAYDRLLKLPSLHKHIEDNRSMFESFPESTRELILYAYHLHNTR